MKYMVSNSEGGSGLSRVSIKGRQGAGRRPRSDHGGVLSRFGREANSGVKLGRGRVNCAAFTSACVDLSKPGCLLISFPASHIPLTTCPSPPPPTHLTSQNNTISGGIQGQQLTTQPSTFLAISLSTIKHTCLLSFAPCSSSPHAPFSLIR